MRHLRKEVEMSGDCWKTENGALLFIYTSVITVSLASNSSTNIPLVARYHYPLSHYCSFGAVFALISFTSKANCDKRKKNATEKKAQPIPVVRLSIDR